MYMYSLAVSMLKSYVCLSSQCTDGTEDQLPTASYNFVSIADIESIQPGNTIGETAAK